MQEQDFYPNAPIVEAIFDIQVELPKGIGIAELEAFCSTLSSTYPEKKERSRFAGKFEIKDNKESSAESFNLGVEGFLNWSSDRKQVVQVRLDGFSFSRLKPYEKWNLHFAEFIKHFKLYCEKFSPVRIKRVTTRFINVINLPRGDVNWTDYFINAARAPIPNVSVTNFFDRVEFAFPSSNIKAVVTHAIMQSNDPIKLPIVLDIETFMEMSADPDINMVEKIFQQLHGLKNQVFRESLTPKAKELFK